MMVIVTFFFVICFLGHAAGSVLLNSTSTLSAPVALSTGIVCNNTFSQISAATWVKRVNPGWNLGNTLEATPSEGDWNNPPVVPSTFDYVKKQGFKGIRIPGKISNMLRETPLSRLLQSHMPTTLPLDPHHGMSIPLG